MFPFYFLVLTPCLIRILPIRGKDDQQRSQLSLKWFFVLLFCLLALRHLTVGLDLRNYRSIFLSTTRLEWNTVLHTDIEVGYSILNRAVAMVTTDFQWFLAFVGLITLLPIGFTYVRESEDAILSIALFICMSTFVILFSGIRQSIAIGMGMVAYHFTKQKKILPYLLTVTVAMFIHTSAFMLILMYPAYHTKISRRMLLVVVPVLGLIFIFNRPIFSFLQLFLDRYRMYSGVTSTGAYAMLILFAMFSVAAFVIPDEEKMDRDTSGLRNFLLLSLTIQMFAPLHMLAMRMNYYYIIFIPLTIPKLLNRSLIRWNQVAVAAKYILTAFLLIYFFVDSRPQAKYLNVFPYHFFWENI